MIQRDRSACKYVEIFTHRVGSKGAPRGGTNAKSREGSNMASRNTKTSIIQKGGAGFKATINLNEEDVYADLEGAILVSLRQTYNYRNYEGSSDRNRQIIIMIMITTIIITIFM
jgi:hypothetical protein